MPRLSGVHYVPVQLSTIFRPYTSGEGQGVGPNYHNTRGGSYRAGPREQRAPNGGTMRRPRVRGVASCMLCPLTRILLGHAMACPNKGRCRLHHRMCLENVRLLSKPAARRISHAHGKRVPPAASMP